MLLHALGGAWPLPNHPEHVYGLGPVTPAQYLSRSLAQPSANGLAPLSLADKQGLLRYNASGGPGADVAYSGQLLYVPHSYSHTDTSVSYSTQPNGRTGWRWVLPRANKSLPSADAITADDDTGLAATKREAITACQGIGAYWPIWEQDYSYQLGDAPPLRAVVECMGGSAFNLRPQGYTKIISLGVTRGATGTEPGVFSNYRAPVWDIPQQSWKYPGTAGPTVTIHQEVYWFRS